MLSKPINTSAVGHKAYEEILQKMEIIKSEPNFQKDETPYYIDAYGKVGYSRSDLSELHFPRPGTSLSDNHIQEFIGIIPLIEDLLPKIGGYQPDSASDNIFLHEIDKLIIKSAEKIFTPSVEQPKKSVSFNPDTVEPRMVVDSRGKRSANRTILYGYDDEALEEMRYRKSPLRDSLTPEEKAEYMKAGEQIDMDKGDINAKIGASDYTLTQRKEKAASAAPDDGWEVVPLPAAEENPAVVPKAGSQDKENSWAAGFSSMLYGAKKVLSSSMGADVAKPKVSPQNVAQAPSGEQTGLGESPLRTSEQKETWAASLKQGAATKGSERS